MAEVLAAFIAGARRTLSVAIYDLKLETAAAATVRAAFVDARARGVVARLVWNLDQPRCQPVPRPGFIDYSYVESLAVEHRHIDGVPDLMHHKYVVRDAGTPQAAVWTGSTNWTNDSWTREENVIVRIQEAGLAAAYQANFEELWEKLAVQGSGHETPEWYVLDDRSRARPYFTPVRAQKLVHELSQRIASASVRLRICSPVVTSGPILGTLAEVAQRPGLEFAGCYDYTQMAEVQSQWSAQAHSAWKAQAWQSICAQLPWGAKRSTPYQPDAVHDYMHAKCLVADDFVFAGSYNLSHSGEANAENVIELEDASLADAFAAYVDSVAARYGGHPIARR